MTSTHPQMLQPITSFEWKLIPLSPCFQKASTLSCKQTVGRVVSLTYQWNIRLSFMCSLCFYLKFQWGSQRPFQQPAPLSEALRDSQFWQFLSSEHQEWDKCIIFQYDGQVEKCGHECEVTYFPVRRGQCLCLAGLLVLPCEHHHLLTEWNNF